MKNQIREKVEEKNQSSKAISRLFHIEKGSPRYRVIGLFMLLQAVYLAIAFTSFWFTWQEDQSEVLNSYWQFFLQNEIIVENWLGKIGAILSHFFIYKGFGLASFAIPYISFLLGFKMFFDVALVPIKKQSQQIIWLMLWFSILTAFFFNEDASVIGGSFGFQMQIWLVSWLGNIGTIFFLVFTLTLILMLLFNVTFELAAIKKLQVFLKNDINNLFQKRSNFDTQIDEQEEFTFNEIADTTAYIPMPGRASIETQTPAITPSENLPENPSVSAGDELEPIIIKEKTLTVEEQARKIREMQGEYDPTLELSSFKMPTANLLRISGNNDIEITKEELESNKQKIVATLDNYQIKIASIKATIGPTVTLYEIVPAPGVKIAKIKNLQDDIALSLAALGIRIIAPMPGKGTIGIEVPNLKPSVVGMRSVLLSERFQNAKMELPVALGKTISNETFVFDLAKMPHLLMAGATGQGKSVGLNVILASLLFKKHPSQLKLVLVDPKKVELTLYNKIEKHYLAKLPNVDEAIITDNKRVIDTLNSLCIEMDNRYELLKEAEARNISEYNEKFIARRLNPEKGHAFLPYIVVVIDEFADLIMTAGKEVELPIARLAQLARAIGIHLIIATQRPSTNIITGTIKANFPGRIAFRVTSGIDSRTILDSVGAEQLIGRGDMLLSNGADLTRIQCAFVDTDECEQLCQFIGSQQGYGSAFHLPEYVSETASANEDWASGDRDALFEEAARIIVTTQQGSASMLQRRLKLGYNRAGRLVDQLEAAGIIGPSEGSKARQVLIGDEQSLEQFLRNKRGN